MADLWLAKLQSAQKTCLIQDDRRKIHFTFADGTEMAEEYDVKTADLLVRKWRKKGTLGGVGRWEMEVGEQSLPVNLEAEGLMESNANPIFVRKDTKSHFQWRIRNLPYPINNYKVTAKPEERHIIISTVNKKYYKKFNIPDLDRCHLGIDQSSIEFAHANNTLIVSYKKPQEVLEMERKFLQEMKKMKASKDGDVDCTPS
ncbi:protein dpcd-like [Plakobranchus ocellatus]|uniref:Protein DPCD n=1 Tax=Plakobranchus ocellatus TaxID=259542 RepID=A0AAV4DQC9_9GAST|nr:protein dpcd-like [Plakobranchus ocellatus]